MRLIAEVIAPRWVTLIASAYLNEHGLPLIEESVARFRRTFHATIASRPRSNERTRSRTREDRASPSRRDRKTAKDVAISRGGCVRRAATTPSAFVFLPSSPSSHRASASRVFPRRVSSASPPRLLHGFTRRPLTRLVCATARVHQMHDRG